MVEVGINIPSATLMVIEEANKFGLAQLHQLRGRISRSNKQSNCVLMHNQNLSEMSLKKLLILRNNDDGFEISEKDMFLKPVCLSKSVICCLESLCSILVPNLSSASFLKT